MNWKFIIYTTRSCLSGCVCNVSVGEYFPIAQLCDWLDLNHGIIKSAFIMSVIRRLDHLLKNNHQRWAHVLQNSWLLSSRMSRVASDAVSSLNVLWTRYQIRCSFTVARWLWCGRVCESSHNQSCVAHSSYSSSAGGLKHFYKKRDKCVCASDANSEHQQWLGPVLSVCY